MHTLDIQHQSIYQKDNLPAVRLLNIPWLRWADLNQLLGTRISPCFKNGIAKLATHGRIRFYLKNLNRQLFLVEKKNVFMQTFNRIHKKGICTLQTFHVFASTSTNLQTLSKTKTMRKTTRKQNNQPPTMTSLGRSKNAKNPLNPATGTEFLPTRGGVAAAKHLAAGSNEISEVALCGPKHFIVNSCA